MQRGTKIKAILILIAVLVSIIAGLVIYFVYFSGRSASRMLGKDARQVISVPNMKHFISISFTKRGKSTVKDVTFLATDGYIYTVEYRDLSPLEGVIRWVPHDQSDDVIQSRGISRWLGAVINLRLPKDCAQVIGVDISYAGPDERVKNLTYKSTGGKIFSKEFRQGLFDRHMEGWLEVVAKP